LTRESAIRDCEVFAERVFPKNILNGISDHRLTGELLFSFPGLENQGSAETLNLWDAAALCSRLDEDPDKTWIDAVAGSRQVSREN
jgi:hypothetical protein